MYAARTGCAWYQVYIENVFSWSVASVHQALPISLRDRGPGIGDDVLSGSYILERHNLLVTIASDRRTHTLTDKNNNTDII